MKITLSEEIYDAIIAAIIQGEIHSDSVVTEALLMERFHVSKSPVRESLVRLCHENILVSIRFLSTNFHSHVHASQSVRLFLPSS